MNSLSCRECEPDETETSDAQWTAGGQSQCKQDRGEWYHSLSCGVHSKGLLLQLCFVSGGAWAGKESIV